jgi:hypothetical protein
VPVEKTEREIATLIGEVSRGEIKLPEIQRSYVWKPTQVAKLIESLYRGYPTGSLLFWKTTETPRSRDFAIDGTPPPPVVQPLYLLDGQQRLTALYRVLGDDQGTQVVFNVETEAFQNQSAATARDQRWVKVREVTQPDADLYGMVENLHEATAGLGRNEIARRLQRLAGIRSQKYYMEILTDFPYEEIAQIFVRVNSGGRSLRTSDLALATLSARWPGVVDRLEAEARLWSGRAYEDVDITFLTRALTGAVLGRGLSTWSHARLVAATDEELERGWLTVQRGLRVLISLLKTTWRSVTAACCRPCSCYCRSSCCSGNGRTSHWQRRPPTRSCTGSSSLPSGTGTAGPPTRNWARTSRQRDHQIRYGRFSPTWALWAPVSRSPHAILPGAHRTARISC